MQHCAVTGLYGDKIGCLGSVELGFAHVGGKAVHDLERAGVVDAEIAGGIGEGEFLV
jgi:hypothetical protein